MLSFSPLMVVTRIMVLIILVKMRPHRCTLYWVNTIIFSIVLHSIFHLIIEWHDDFLNTFYLFKIEAPSSNRYLNQPTK